MSNRRIPITLTALGWAETQRRAAAISKDQKFRGIGAADRNQERAHPPRPLNFELAPEALASGSGVLTEKRFVINLDQDKQKEEQARESGRILAIVHNLLFNRSATVPQHEGIATGRLGKTREDSGRLGKTRENSGKLDSFRQINSAIRLIRPEQLTMPSSTARYLTNAPLTRDN